MIGIRLSLRRPAGVIVGSREPDGVALRWQMWSRAFSGGNILCDPVPDRDPVADPWDGVADNGELYRCIGLLRP